MGKKTVVETIGLTKIYDGFTAVDKLNLQISEGEVFGFLGPNGAGKTTTILMLLGLTEPTSGVARVYGYNSTREALKVKRLTGYLPEKVGFYDDLTARQNLQYIARLNSIPEEQADRRIGELLDLVGLSEAADQGVGKFSRGMEQRLGMAGALVKSPRVAFLDEPTAGIDPEGISQILDLIARVSREEGTTIIISSHQLHQVQTICNEVGIMSKGRLVVHGPIERLGREVLGKGRFQIELQVSEPSPHLLDSINNIEGVRNIEVSQNLLFIGCDLDLRPQIARAVVDSDSLLVQMKLKEYGLEEIYLKYFRES